MFNLKFILISSVLLFTNCLTSSENKEPMLFSDLKEELSDYDVAYFASGCFWCVEAIFESVNGVKEAVSGYSGGHSKNATYKKVSAGLTNHAETVAVYYDSDIIDYQTLLIVFFGSHDPTTKNQQGPDKGSQYRSVIFYQNDQEKQLSENYIRKLLDDNVFDKITTELTEFEAFYPAEKHHQNYKQKNPNDSYVKNVSKPRLERFKKNHKELLK